MSEKGNCRMKNIQDTRAESPHKIMSPSWELKYSQTNKHIKVLWETVLIVVSIPAWHSTFPPPFPLISSLSHLPRGPVRWDHTPVHSDGECLLPSSTPSLPSDYTLVQPLSHLYIRRGLWPVGIPQFLHGSHTSVKQVTSIAIRTRGTSWTSNESGQREHLPHQVQCSNKGPDVTIPDYRKVNPEKGKF